MQWSLALGLVLVGWPMGRALLRRRGLRHGSREARLGVSLALIYAVLRDHGIEVPRSQTLDETARYLQERLDLDADDLVARIQAVLFGGRAATAQDLADLAAFRRRLLRRLLEREGWTTTVLALFGVPAFTAEKPPRPAPAARVWIARR